MERTRFLEKKEKEIVKFLQKLVQTPSQNGIDSEKNIALVVGRKLKEFGLRPKLVGDKERPSVLCFLGNNKGKKLFFNAHLDTVPIGNLKGWQYSPFSGKIVGDKLYGRGSADSKAGIAIFCYLAGALAKAKKELNGQLILGFDSDEESGEFTGFKNLIREIDKVEATIIGYPGIDEIVIGGRGFLRLRITTFGKSAHTGSRSQKGLNAILKMNKVISVLQRLSFIKNSPSQVKESLFWFGPKLTISQISGGRAINIVPDECFINVDIRLVPGQTKKQILEVIKKALKNLAKKEPDLKFKIKTLQYQPAFKTNPKEKIVRLLKKKAEKILKKKVKLVASGAGGVGSLLVRKKIPTISGFGVEFANVHAADEWVNLKTISPVAKIYLETVIDFFS